MQMPAKSKLVAHAKASVAVALLASSQNFWNQAKRVLRKYNGIPKESFPLFLREYEFRFN